ncbi:HtaA domain-containing protein [Lentzea sp. JNUCC 0626]|uniref:HtaA domain-containing protein n=1 Tax=Lentzea sp. JNUCC 0626 TaxID=3367513 RepID=UPI00374A732D
MRRTFAVLAVAAALVTATPVSAQEQMTPSVTVSPNVSGLHPDGEKITLSGAGFDPKANDGKGWGVRVGPKRDGWRDKTTTTSQYSKLLKENWAVGINLKADGTWQATPTVKANYKVGSEEFSAATEQLYLMIFSWDSPDTTRDLVIPLQFNGVTSPSQPRQGSLSWKVTDNGTGTPSDGTINHTWPLADSTPTTLRFGGRIDVPARITKPTIDLVNKTLTVDVNGVTTKFADFKGQPVYNGNNATLQAELTLTEQATTALNGTPPAITATITYPVAAPTLTLQQSEVEQNGTLSFTANGFAGNEQVSLDDLGTFTTNAEGSVQAQARTTKAPGQHTVTATGLTSKRTASATYTVKVKGCEATTVDKGTVLWGFKKSFRDYIGKGSGNSITGTNGAVVTDQDATPNANGVTTGAHQYAFQKAQFTSKQQFEVQFQGTITFSYPAHFFTIHLSNPKVEVTNATGKLKADVELQTSGQTPGKPTKLTGVDLADLDLRNATTSDNAGVLTVTGIKSTLTNSEAFAGFYGAGDKLDDLTLTLGSSCAQLPEQPGPAAIPPAQAPQDLVPPLAFRPQRLANTGASPLVALALGIVLVGSGIALLVTTSPGRRT